MTLFERGTRATIRLTLIATGASIPLAVVLGAARRTTPRVVRLLLDSVVELIRGVPIIVFLFWLFFALPALVEGAQLSSFTAASLSLILYGGAFSSEMVRGTLEALPKGQRDAVHALHLSMWDGFRRVILPQAMPILLPRFANHSIEMLKASALVSFVGYQELNFWTTQVRTQTRETLAPYLIALIIFFALAMAISLFFRLLESLTHTSRIDRITKRQRGDRRPIGLLPRMLPVRGGSESGEVQ